MSHGMPPNTRLRAVAVAFLLVLLLALPAIAAGDDYAYGKSDRGLLSCKHTAGRVLRSVLLGSGACPPPASASASASSDDIAPTKLQIILAGFPRCGSSSLKMALERLSYAACHGSEAWAQPRMMRAYMFHNAAGVVEETERLGYNATLELVFPLWEEMYALRPDAKVILLTRDAQAWVASMARIQALAQTMFRWPHRLYMDWQHRIIDHYLAFFTGDVDGCVIGDSCDADSPRFRQLLLDARERYIARVREVVPAGNWLELNLDAGYGYAELCAFLGIAPGDCPDEPYPRANARADLDHTRHTLLVLEGGVYLGLCVLVILFWVCCRRRRKCE